MEPRNLKPLTDSDIPLVLPESDAGSRGLLSEGSRFRAYVVGPCIGHGGMARVYRAQHEALQRQVALKVMKGLATDVESRLRFVREARIAAAIKHPNVVNIFDVGVHQGIAYLAMELLEGQDLETLLTSQGALEERRMVDIMVPIVAALVAVHDAGIVHRDLKPGNVFLARGKTGDVEPKLLDFGVSKGSEPDLLRLSWANGPLLGTPAYVSPEAAAGRDVTPLSDQYSLGVLMYECIAGVHPFAAKTMEETLTLISAGTHVPPRDHRPDLSPRLASIIERAMRLDAAERFPDLRQLGRELLILAGQRTRMTWALTFGVEIESAPARVPTERISISVRGASPSSSPKPAIVQWQTSRLPLAIAAGVLLVGVGALFLRGRTLTMRIHAGGPNVVLAPTVIDSRASLDSRVADSRRDALGASSASASAFAPTPQEAPPVAAEPRTAEPWTAEAPAPSQEASDWQAASAAQFGFERPALKTTKSRADDRSRRATASRPAPHAAPSHDSDHPPAPPPATDDTASSGPVIGANGAPIFD